MLPLLAKPHASTLAIFVAVILAVANLIPATAEASQDGIVVSSTSKPYDKVVTAMKKAITSNKLVIVKAVPYMQMLKMVGVKAEKSIGFEIFHPRYGKVIYAKDKRAMVEAPMRIMVRKAGSKVIVRYRKPSASLAGYSGLSALGKELDTIFSRIVATATK